MRRSSISVRGLAAIAAACALLCVAAASASAAPLVWTANTGSDSVSTIDGATGKEVGKPIPAGDEPSAIALTPDGSRAVVTDSNGKSAEVIDTAARKVLKTIPLPSYGDTVAISPDGKAAYVTSESEKVLVIDPATATVTGTVELEGEATSAIAFSPDGRLAYIGLTTKKIVTVDTRTGKVVGSAIKLEAEPHMLAFTPDGKTLYVRGGGVAVVNVALGQVVKTIPTKPTEPIAIAMSPSGGKLYLAFGEAASEAVGVVDTATNEVVGSPIPLSHGAYEIAITADGETAFVAYGDEVTPVNLVTGVAETPIPMPGDGIFGLAISPDQSPTAAFTAPAATVGSPALFSGAASSDPDGTVAGWSWSFGDGGTATGVGPSNTFPSAGTFNTKLSVVDNEGCGEAEVFTGRTAFCSGNLGASVIHPVEVAKASQAVTVTTEPSNNFKFGRTVHDRRNGTVRIQVTLPSSGFVLLFGKKVHAVTRKSKGVQTMWLTLHARVELAKRLKKVMHAPVSFRVTFTPNGGTPKTVHRTVSLQRLPRHKHRPAGH